MSDVAFVREALRRRPTPNKRFSSAAGRYRGDMLCSDGREVHLWLGCDLCCRHSSLKSHRRGMNPPPTAPLPSLCQGHNAAVFRPDRGRLCLNGLIYRFEHRGACVRTTTRADALFCRLSLALTGKVTLQTHTQSGTRTGQNNATG